MKEQKKPNTPVLIGIVIRIFGFIYGLFHLMFLISFVILTMDSSVGLDAISIALMAVALMGTWAGYVMLRGRYSSFLHKLLIGVSLSLFLVGSVGLSLVAPKLV